MNKNQVYKLSNIKQLIDLNGDIVNFTLSFEVISKTNQPFDALVVTQEMLDSGEELQYQRAEGSINGQITNDQDIYNNYFLILKSDEPNECNVSIELVEIEPVSKKIKTVTKPKVAKSIPWKTYLFYFFVILVILTLIYILYITLFKNEDTIKDDINKFSNGIEEKITGLNNGVEGLNSKLNNITKSLDGLEGGLSNKIERSLDGLQGGLTDKISQSIDGLNHGLSTKISESLDGLSNGFNKFDESLHGITEKFDGFNSGLANKFDSGFQEINHKLSELDGGISNKLTNGLTEIKGELVETIGSLPAEIKPSTPSISTEDIYNKIQNLKLKS